MRRRKNPIYSGNNKLRKRRDRNGSKGRGKKELAKR